MRRTRSTADAPNRIVENSGEGNVLEAWRRLHNEYDPTSSMRRVRSFSRFRTLGAALDDWLPKIRQYEMFTERNGRPIRRQPCGGHVPVDAKELGGDRHVHQMRTRASAQSIQMSESKKSTEKDDPMDVDALNKGAGKGKSERKTQEGQRPKPHEQRQVLELRQVWALWP